jgi:hypothetical protein
MITGKTTAADLRVGEALYSRPSTKQQRSFQDRKYTEKKENLIFLLYKEIQNGAVAKSLMTNGVFIYG